MKSRVASIGKLLVLDLAGSVVWFPVWWYTRGLQSLLNIVFRTISYRIREYSFVVWIRNFFVPMYGQYDWTGRLISVLMRFVVLVGRCIALLIEILLYTLGIAVWLLFPLITLLMVFQSGFSFLFEKGPMID